MYRNHLELHYEKNGPSPRQRQLDHVQESAIIHGEKGILERHGLGFHFPSPFAKQNLFYVIWADEFLLNTEYMVKRDFLDAFEIYLVEEGTMFYRYEGKDYHAGPGDVIFLDLRRPVYYKAESQVLMHQVMFDGNASGGYFDLLMQRYGPVTHCGSRVAHRFRKLQQELLKDMVNDHYISLLLHNILSGVLLDQQEMHTTDPVTEAQYYIKEHFKEQISLDMIAENCGLSKYYFSRQFKEQTGFTPWDYLTSQRIRLAMQLLSNTKMSIEQVSEECGYQSASHFVRAFKKAAEMTPTSFRRHYISVTMGESD